MRINGIQMLPTFNSVITVLNKLKASDSKTHLDQWYGSILFNNTFVSRTSRTVLGTTVNIGGNYIVRIPKNERYKPYDIWLKDTSQGFTLSVGDIVIKGEISETVITSSTVNQILQKYRPNAFVISAFKDNTGIVGLAEHYCIEGV